MKAKVIRRGGELMVLIPEEVAREESIAENSDVQVYRHEADDLSLEEMVGRITPETLHGETDWGPDVGNEIVP